MVTGKVALELAVRVVVDLEVDMAALEMLVLLVGLSSIPCW